MIKLSEYDESKLNNFFKIEYDLKDSITIFSENIHPCFDWIKIQNLERKIVLKNNTFPKKSSILSLNKNSDLNIVTIQFQINLNKYLNEQIIQKPLNFDKKKIHIQSLKNINNESFLVQF